MKNKFIFTALLSAAALLAFTSCKDNGPDDTTGGTTETLTFKNLESPLAQAGGQATFDIVSNTNWELEVTYPEGAAEWITTISPEDGNGNATVTLTFSANATDAIRTAYIKATYGSAKKTKQQTVDQSKLAAAIPADAPAIQSDKTESDNPIELSVAQIENAVTYIWRNGTTVVQSTTARTYTARQSGDYTVAGANADGVEGKPSPVKTITVNVTETEIIPTFNSIPEGNYSATGAAHFNDSASSFSGALTTQEGELTDGSKRYLYYFDNWGADAQYGLNCVMWEEATKRIWEPDFPLQYFEAEQRVVYAMFLYEGTQYLETPEQDEYKVMWNESAKTLDFTGQVGGKDVFIGSYLWQINSDNTMSIVGVYGDAYTNCVITYGGTKAYGAPAVKADRVFTSFDAVNKTYRLNGTVSPEVVAKVTKMAKCDGLLK